MVWRAHSLDLNPIENVWRLLKYRIGKQFPKADAEVRQYPLEEWERLDLQDFMKYPLLGRRGRRSLGTQFARC